MTSKTLAEFSEVYRKRQFDSNELETKIAYTQLKLLAEIAMQLALINERANKL